MNSFESKNTKLGIKNNLERNKNFSVEQELFLNKELEKMNDDTLMEEDFRGKIDDATIDKCLLDIEEYDKIFTRN